MSDLHRRSILRRWRNRPEDGRDVALTAVASGYFLFVGTQMIFPVLLPYLRSAYDLTLTAAGLLFTTIWLANALGTLPGGAITDRIGGVPVLITSVLLSAGAITLVVLADSVVLLFGATAIFGVGLAMYGIARFPVTQDLYPDHLGTVTGVTLAAADAGQTVLPPIASIVAVVVVWQLGFGFTVPLFLLVAVFLWWSNYIRVPDSVHSTPATNSWNVRYLLGELRRPTVVFGTVILCIYGTIWAAFTGFYPTYLVEVKTLPTTTAAFLFALFFGTGIFVKPASGIAYDRLGLRRALLLAAAIPGFAFAALPFTEGVWTLVIVTVFAAPILGSAAIVQPYVLEVFPEDLRGTGLASVRTIFLLFTAASPLLFGAVADLGYFDQMYYVLAILAFTNVALVLRIPVVPVR